jgi:hypothetical protein
MPQFGHIKFKFRNNPEEQNSVENWKSRAYCQHKNVRGILRWSAKPTGIHYISKFITTQEFTFTTRKADNLILFKNISM